MDDNKDNKIQWKAMTLFLAMSEFHWPELKTLTTETPQLEQNQEPLDRHVDVIQRKPKSNRPSAPSEWVLLEANGNYDRAKNQF